MSVVPIHMVFLTEHGSQAAITGFPLVWNLDEYFEVWMPQGSVDLNVLFCQERREMLEQLTRVLMVTLGTTPTRLKIHEDRRRLWPGLLEQLQQVTFPRSTGKEMLVKLFRQVIENSLAPYANYQQFETVFVRASEHAAHRLMRKVAHFHRLPVASLKEPTENGLGSHTVQDVLRVLLPARPTPACA